jgi:hypothetical protein
VRASLRAVRARQRAHAHPCRRARAPPQEDATGVVVQGTVASGRWLTHIVNCFGESGAFDAILQARLPARRGACFRARARHATAADNRNATLTLLRRFSRRRSA